MNLITYVSESWLLGVVILIAIPAIHLFTWLIDKHGIRSVPGPMTAAFSDVWLAYWAAQGKRSERVHEMHQKYGKFVRLAPNHISISEPDALEVVYAHGNGTTKSDFYDAFVSIGRGMFNTRSRSEHTRKRKIVSHIFSPKNVLAFEPNVGISLGKLVAQWDKLCKGGAKNLLVSNGEREGEGRIWFNCLPWYNYLAFDIIGDLAFGAPFGMLEAGQDIAPVSIISAGKEKKIIHVPAVKILNARGDYSASMGVIPPWIRPLIKRLPWYARGNQAVGHLSGMAVVAVEKRLADPSAGERGDLLSKLQKGKDEHGNPMGKEELTAEALTQLIAGSDTIANSSCGITYYLARYPEAQRKLQAELDEVLGIEEGVVLYDSIKKLPYLEACINESLRLHSPSGIGLPRLVPHGGLEVCGRFFKEGTVLSVPTYSLHMDESVWGKNVDTYIPERWFERDPVAMQKASNTFSFGPRACVGKNLAILELFVVIATIFKRYEFVLGEPHDTFQTQEGFLRKPTQVRIGMKRRNVL